METIIKKGSGLDPLIEKQVQKLAANFYKKLVNKGLNVGELFEELISQLSIDILYFDFDQPGVDGKKIHGIYLRSPDVEKRKHKIVINTNDNEKTQNFTLAHELFHHLLMEEQTSELAKLLENEEWLERAGDYFAACFLMKSENFKVTYDFLSTQYKLEEIVLKLSDAFITPYESVIRRLVELELLPKEDYYLLDLRESNFIDMREEIMGPTVLDDPSRKNVFQPYVNLIVKGLSNGDFTYLDAIKRLNRVNPKRAQEIEAEYQAKLAKMEDDEED